MKITVIIDSLSEDVNPMSAWSALEHVTEAYRDFLAHKNRVDACFTVAKSFETASITVTNPKRDVFGRVLEERK
jgi:hypothetical protein